MLIVRSLFISIKQKLLINYTIKSYLKNLYKNYLFDNEH